MVAPEANGDVLRLSLSSEFTGQVTVRQVNPQPDTVVIGSGGTTYEWHVSDWSQPVGVDVEYEPDDWGRISGAVVVEAGDAEMVEIGFDQIVFP